MNEIKIIDLFSGIGGFRKGIERAICSRSQQKQNREGNNIPQEGIGGHIETAKRKPAGLHCVFSADIDKYATAVYNYNFKENWKPTDITKLKSRDIPDHDILCGGFPCQSFSIAGKRKGFNDTRGTMFFEICRIARDKKSPVLFLENVKGLLSHGNRTTGIFYNPGKKTYSTEKTQGSDEVTLKTPGETFSIITNTLYELGYLGGGGIINSKNHGVPQNRERVFIVAVFRGKSGRKIFPIGENGNENNNKQIINQLKGKTQFGWHFEQNVFGINGISRAIKSSEGSGNKLKIIIEQIPQIELKQLNNPTHSNNRVYGSDGVCPTLNTMQGGNRQPKIVIPVLTPDRLEKRQNGRRFKEPGEEMFTQTAQDRHGILSNSRIRRLTPTECERLQGYPDNWTKYGMIDGKKTLMSNAQRYKMCGNSVTVNVIEAIAERILESIQEDD